MLRFTALALPLLLLILALFCFGAELAGLTPFGSTVGRALLGGATRVPLAVVLGTWALEATGLVALFLLLEGRCGSWWLDGLLTGWVAWIFRGPLVVVTVLGATNQGADSWWTLAIAWLALYSFCGLVLAVLSGRAEARRRRRRIAAEPGSGWADEPAPMGSSALHVEPR